MTERSSWKYGVWSRFPARRSKARRGRSRKRATTIRPRSRESILDAVAFRLWPRRARLTTGARRQGRQRGETGSVCLALVKFQARAQTSGRLVSYYYLFCHNANIMRRMNLAQYPFRRAARHRSLPDEFRLATTTARNVPHG